MAASGSDGPASGGAAAMSDHDDDVLKQLVLKQLKEIVSNERLAVRMSTGGKRGRTLEHIRGDIREARKMRHQQRSCTSQSSTSKREMVPALMAPVEKPESSLGEDQCRRTTGKHGELNAGDCEGQQ